MPNDDDLSLDLSRLEKDYKILTELHREDDSRTFLARHLGLDRDVTITVSRAPGDDDRALIHLAADARLLAIIRHPNLIPVIEGVWLDEHTLAVVRERANGSTLDQLIGAGPVPVARVAATIEQAQVALDRARADGIVHRNILPRSVVFEQGNGRVVLSLEPGPLSGDAKPDESDDARTIGRLASEMLSGRIGGNGEPSSAENVPPQIAPAIAEALEAVRSCDRSSASTAVAGLMTVLKSTAESSTKVADGGQPAGNAGERERTPVVDPAVAPPARLPTRPRRRVREEAVVAAPSRFGFNARLGTAIAIAAIIAAGGVFLFRQRDALDPRLSVAANDTQQAAGDVAPARRRLDSAASRGSSPSIATAQPPAQPTATPPETSRTPQKPETTSTVTPRPAQTPETTSTATPRPAQAPDTTSTAIPRVPIAPPDTPRHEPPKTAPPATFPMPPDSTSTTTEQKPQRDSVAPASDTNACASPTAEDQQKCLTAAIDRSDGAVNGVLAKLIAALRRQAGATAANDPDPVTVDQLRAGQRTWVDERDSACRDAGEPPLYARGRSACFAEQSANRTRELQRMLDAIPPSS